MSVPFNNIPGDLRVPLFYAEMDNSYANSGAVQLRRLLIGQVNDSSTADSALTIASKTDEVTQLAGAGSPLAQMYATHRKNDSFGETWILPVKVATGTNASATITVTSSPTSAGVIYLYVADQRIALTVTTSMSPDEIAAGLTSKINSTETPVSATADKGIVTIKAKFKGLLGNDIALSLNNGGTQAGETLPTGLTLNITQMAGGVGAPDMTLALASIGDEPFEFITNAFTDSTSLNALRDFMNDTTGRWSWSRMLYGHVFSAKRGTLGELTAFGRTFNDQHSTVYGFEKSISTASWNCAAAYAARTAVFISIDPSRPTQTGVLTGVTPPAKGKAFEMTERQTLLWSGIATAYTEGDAVRIERSVTQYQRNAYGVADDSYLDAETLFQSAHIVRYLRAMITSKYGRHKLANDGTRFDEGQAIVTPKVIKAELIACYKFLERQGHVENSKAFEQHLIVERDAQNPNRMNVLFPPDYVNQLRVFALLNQFRLQYQEA